MNAAMYFAKRALAGLVPDRLYVRLAFFKSHGWFPRTPPVTFNEYLCELKGSGDLAQYQVFADKYAVRDHVAGKLGAHYLVPLHATATRLTRDLWETLPASFVLKTNHGSRWHRIVRNKADEDYASIAAQADRWLKKNFYYVRREQQYRDIEPVLMFETLLTETNREPIKDYKFFCFHGRVAFILLVDKKDGEFNYYYDRNWNKLDITRKGRPGKDFPAPDNLQQMIEVAEVLAEPFTFVRVDLYNVQNHIYFSELTFIPGGGSGRFRSDAFEECAGRLWAGDTVDLSPFHEAINCVVSQ